MECKATWGVETGSCLGWPQMPVACLWRGAVLAATLLGSAGVCSAQESLASLAAREWFSGVTIDGETDDGMAIQVFGSPDGRVAALADREHRNSGTWTVREPGHICIAWHGFGWGTDPCFSVFKEGDRWRLVRTNGTHSFLLVTRLPGNPLGL